MAGCVTVCGAVPVPVLYPQNTTAYKNGALNSSPGGGPVGIWTYDAGARVSQWRRWDVPSSDD